jgi:ParB-like chromosome segregation protein Spo0J
MNKLIYGPNVPIGELVPSTYNPRRWDDKEISDLTRSIKEHGFVVPILANSNKA